MLIFVLLLLAAIFANQIAPYDYPIADWEQLRLSRRMGLT
ncbi:MAG: hypothetical protein IPK17_00210 [Chloroflexi bacterium]|nr:hypothetical protein [Chloroflexota bacterium]